MAALRPGLTPDQRQHLANIDNWNRYADKMNAKAIAAGVVDAETVRPNHERATANRRDLLARWLA